LARLAHGGRLALERPRANEYLWSDFPGAGQFVMPEISMTLRQLTDWERVRRGERIMA
jgi:hypothetical protein